MRQASDVVDLILSRTGRELRIATPLGLGKPNILLNAIYSKAKADPGLQLKMYTALSLNPPRPHDELGKRFFGPFLKRHWGDHYPDLEYAKDAVANRLPANVHIHEFYFLAGAAINSLQLQRDYQSINYTHVAEAVFQRDAQVITQLIARHPTDAGKFSLSCNPDVTIDLVDLYRQANKPIFIVGVVHPDLPYLEGEAAVGEDFFDVILDDGKKYELFGIPRLPISNADHAIGFYASQLVADDGTLQVGIGSLSDAVISSVLTRHSRNDLYLRLCDLIWQGRTASASLPLERKPFTQGIYGLSEMVTDGYMHLRKAGILKREVVDEKSGLRTYLHGAFFLGSSEFYAWLRGLKGDDLSGLRMGRVSKVNDLYDPHEVTLRRQRKNPRFLNTCMQVTLLGGAASETIENGHVVSGVGGQYNFVAMSAELRNSRSILMLRSTRTSRGKRSSNIVWSHGQLTIPRHLRDLVITEYGIADLRNKTDEEVICALLNVTDSEFQDELARIAKKNGKLASDYKIPEAYLHNTPERLHGFIEEGRKHGVFGAFALGSDFTKAEEKLVLALDGLQQRSADPRLSARLALLWDGFYGMFAERSSYSEELKRMDFDQVSGIKQHFFRGLLVEALKRAN